MSSILILGRHPDLLARAVAMADAAGFTGVGALTDEEALQQLRETRPIAVVIGGGVEAASRRRMHEAAGRQRPAPRVFDVVGGPAGVAAAFAELRRAPQPG